MLLPLLFLIRQCRRELRSYQAFFSYRQAHSTGPQLTASFPLPTNENVQPVVGNWEEKDLREQFHDCLRDQNKFPETDRAQNVLQQMRLHQAEFTLSELTQYEEILTSAQEHHSLTEQLAQIGQGALEESAVLDHRARLFRARLTEARPPIVAEVRTLLTNERAHYCNRQLGLSRDALREQYDELIRACHNTHEAAEAMELTTRTAVEAFRNRSLTAHQLLQRIDDIERRFGHVDHANSALRPQYLENIPVLKAEFFFKGDGSEGDQLRRMMRLWRLLKTYQECSRDPGTVVDLEKRLNKDASGKIKFRLSPGALLRFGSGTQERVVRILDVRGDKKKGGQIRVKMKNGKPWMNPGELYFHLLMETGHMCNITEEKKTKGVRYTPSLETLDDLQHGLGWDPKTQSLHAGGKDGLALVSSKMNSEVLVGNVDDPKGTIGVAHSKNKETGEYTKRQTMDFQQFYDFSKQYELQYSQNKPEREWTATYWTDLKSEKKGSGRSRLSIGGIIKGIKYLGEGFKRMGQDRTEVNGANLARWGADNIEKLARSVGIPWLNGISDTIQSHTIGLIMSKIDKWAEEYRKQLKTGELGEAFKDFYNLPKWKQAALLLAAAEKGLGKVEVYHILKGEGLDPTKWKRPEGYNRPVTHVDYVNALYEYFVDKGDASGLPLKIESRLTPALNSGYAKSVKTGFEETVEEFESQAILDRHRSYFFQPDPKEGKLKSKIAYRKRGVGAIQSALKLGINAPMLGKFILWEYSTVPSTLGGVNKMESSFDGQMMRQIGNTGKYLLPMMGLYRFPRGMALARAIIDYYVQISGQNPYDYEAGKTNDAETTLGYIFAGQWKMVEDRIRHQFGDEHCNVLKYLYFKARAFAYMMEEGAGLSLHMPSGADLDEDTLTDAYGVSGLLSKSWLATVMKTDESGSGQAEHRNWVYAERAGQWWDQLPNKLEEVTPDEAKLFAKNFWEILREDIAVPDQMFKRHWPSIAAVLKKMERGPGNVKVEFSDGGRFLEPKEYDGLDPMLFERITADLKRRKHDNSRIYLRSLDLPHSWMEATKGSIGRHSDGRLGLGSVFAKTLNDGTDEMIHGGTGSNLYNVNVREETRRYIAEAKNYEQKLVDIERDHGNFGIDIDRIRTQIRRFTGDNAEADPWSGGYAEGTD